MDGWERGGGKGLVRWKAGRWVEGGAGQVEGKLRSGRRWMVGEGWKEGEWRRGGRKNGWEVCGDNSGVVMGDG